MSGLLQEAAPPPVRDAVPQPGFLTTALGWLFDMTGAAPLDRDIELGLQPPDARARLRQLHDGWHADRNRRVDPAKAATAFNQVRRYVKAQRQSLRGVTNDTLMEAVTPEMERLWWEAQGLSSRAEVAAFERGAMQAGLINPLGGFIGNFGNYIAPAIASRQTGSPWAAVWVGLAAAGGSPAVNALLQPGVIELCERVREKAGHSVQIDKANVHDREWPAELAGRVTAAVQEYERQGALIGESLSALAGEDPVPQDETAMSALLQRQDPRTLGVLTERCRVFAESEQALLRLQAQLLMTEGSWERQRLGNAHQFWPRLLRGPASIIGALIGNAATPKDQAPTDPLEGAIQQMQQAAPVGSLAAQTALSLTLFAATMACAAYDNRDQHLYNNKLNLMYGDFLTGAGHAKEAGGEEIAAEDIDEGKLRSFLLSPRQALVKRLQATVASQIGRLEAALAGQPQQDGEALPELPPSAMQALLDDLKQGRDLLREGRIDEIPDTSAVGAMLSGDPERFVTQFLGQGLLTKYRKPGELASQAAQRYGQALHMVVLGSVGSSMTGKLASAAAGGVSQLHPALVLLVFAVSAAFGAVGAGFQSAAVNIKNNRRDNMGEPGEIGLMTQFLRGAGSAYHSQQGRKALASANTETVDALMRLYDTNKAADLMRHCLGALGTEAHDDDAA